MKDYIERQMLAGEIERKLESLPRNADGTMSMESMYFGKGLSRALNYINNAQPADVKRIVCGKWEMGRCSICGGHAPYWVMATSYRSSRYCPDCGALMAK